MTTATPTDLATQRVQLFAKRYGEAALGLARHAAFPLSLTSDLVYCLRENLMREGYLAASCPWYAAADLLLSGLCQPIGHDLYEMEPETRHLLLRQLVSQQGQARIAWLEAFMADYILHHARLSERDLGNPRWTALACLRPGDLADAIRNTLQTQLANTDNPRQFLRMAALVESYADLLPDYRPILLDLAEQAASGQAPPAGAVDAAALLGVTLKPLVYEVAKVRVAADAPAAPPPEDGNLIHSGTVETVTVDRRGRIIQRTQPTVYFYREPLPGTAPPLEMMAIPGGRFQMGSPETEEERWEDESPQHEVTVPSFWMGKYPMTQAQWRAIATLAPVDQELDPDPARFKGDNRPVEQVSWEDATEFCARLARETGRPYRLPSEAEWEYACRAGTTTPFHFGETITTELANYNGNTTYADAPKGERRGATTPVDFFGIANGFGLCEMHGNVWEWCADHWHDTYEGAPTDGSACIFSGKREKGRVRRGGSWNYDPWDCRSATRGSIDPRNRNLNVGFRVVCGVPGQ